MNKQHYMAIASHKNGYSRVPFFAEIENLDNIKLEILFLIQRNLGCEAIINSIKFIQISEEHFEFINTKVESK